MTKRNKHHSPADQGTPQRKQGWATWFFPFLTEEQKAPAKKAKYKRVKAPRSDVSAPVSVPVEPDTKFPHANLDPEVEDFLKELHRSLEVKQKGVIGERAVRRKLTAAASAEKRANSLRERLKDLRERRRQAAQEALRAKRESAALEEAIAQSAVGEVIAPEVQAAAPEASVPVAAPAAVVPEVITPAPEPAPIAEAVPSTELVPPATLTESSEKEVSAKKGLLFGLFGKKDQESAAAVPAEAASTPRASIFHRLFRRKAKSAAEAPAAVGPVPAAETPVVPESPVAQPDASAPRTSFFRRLFHRSVKTQAEDVPTEVLPSDIPQPDVAAGVESEAVVDQSRQEWTQLFPAGQPQVEQQPAAEVPPEPVQASAAVDVAAAEQPQIVPEEVAAAPRPSFFRRLFRRRAAEPVQAPMVPEEATEAPLSEQDAVREVITDQPEQTWASMFSATEESAQFVDSSEEYPTSLAQESVGGFFRRLFRRPAPVEAPSVAPVTTESADGLVQITEAPVVSAPGSTPEPPRIRPLKLRNRKRVNGASSESASLTDPSAAPAQEAQEPVVTTDVEPISASETAAPTRGSILSRLFRRSARQGGAVPAMEENPVAQAEAALPETPAPKRRRGSVRDLFKALTYRWSGSDTASAPTVVQMATAEQPTVRAPGTGRMLGPHDAPPAPSAPRLSEPAAEPDASAPTEKAEKVGHIVTSMDKVEAEAAAADAVAEASAHRTKVEAPHIKLKKEEEKPVVVVADSPKVDKRVKKSMDRLKSKSGGFQDFIGAIKYLGLGKEKTGIIQNLATMMNAGLPLIDAIHTLQKESPHKPIRKMLQSVIDMVESGSALWRAMEAQHFFSPHAISLIRIGEEAGNLAENLERLAIQQEKDASLRGKIKMAMIYPTIVIILMFIIVMGLGIFVLPQLIGVLKSLGGELPLVTRIVMMFSDFMSQNALLVIVGTLSTVSIITILGKFTRLKVAFQWISFRIPGIGALAREATIARFGIILGSLLEAGVPLIEALNSLAEVTTIVAYRKFYVRLAEHVNLGDSFSKSFEAIRGSNKLLPVTVQQLIMTGERSGSLAKVLVKVSEIYEKKANETAEKLPVILEPMILLMIGALVGTIAFAIIIPIYSVVGNVGKA